MRMPLRVEYVVEAKRKAGEPSFAVHEADGWPVCLCWSEDYAKRIVAAFASTEKLAADLPAHRAWTEAEMLANDAHP